MRRLLRKLREADVGVEVSEDITESKQETVESTAPETDEKESVEVPPAAVIEAPEAEVKQEHKDQKKSLFGIKFGSKHESKEDDSHADDGTKVKEARWSPFGKKFGKERCRICKN